MSYSLNQVNEAVEFLHKHGCKRESGAWLTRDYEILSVDPVKAAKRLRSLLIEQSHRDDSGGLRKITRG